MPCRMTWLPLASMSSLPDTWTCGAGVLAISVRVTLAGVYPAELAVNVAAPVLVVSAAIVTFCAVFQLAGVKVRLALLQGDKGPVLLAVALTGHGHVGARCGGQRDAENCW